MRRRRLILAACVVLVPALTGVGLPLYALREGVVNRVNFERVQVGMPRERVEQLLGGPGEAARLVDSAGVPLGAAPPAGGVGWLAPRSQGPTGPRDPTVYVGYRDGQAVVAFAPGAASASYWLAASGNPAPVCVVVFDGEGRVAGVARYGGRRPGLLAYLQAALGW